MLGPGHYLTGIKLSIKIFGFHTQYDSRGHCHLSRLKTLTFWVLGELVPYRYNWRNREKVGRKGGSAPILQKRDQFAGA